MACLNSRSAIRIAWRSGWQSVSGGDLMTELGGRPVRDASDLQIRLALLRPGEVAELAVSRLCAHGDRTR